MLRHSRFHLHPAGRGAGSCTFFFCIWAPFEPRYRGRYHFPLPTVDLVWETLHKIAINQSRISFWCIRILIFHLICSIFAVPWNTVCDAMYNALVSFDAYLASVSSDAMVIRSITLMNIDPKITRHIIKTFEANLEPEAQKKGRTSPFQETTCLKIERPLHVQVQETSKQHQPATATTENRDQRKLIGSVTFSEACSCFFCHMMVVLSQLNCSITHDYIKLCMYLHFIFLAPSTALFLSLLPSKKFNTYDVVLYRSYYNRS